jgi:CheY-like chemotaxis protein
MRGQTTTRSGQPGTHFARSAGSAGRSPATGRPEQQLKQGRSQGKNKGARDVRTAGGTTDAVDARSTGKRRMATVLLVDDDSNALDALKELVGQEGYRVRTAADGSDALKSALADPPDVVISDCMMPRMDGLELMRAMRNNRKLADVPLVLVSALVTPPADADVVGFLRKPFAVSQLLDILRRVASP